MNGKIAPKANSLAPSFTRKTEGHTSSDVPTAPTPTDADPSAMIATKEYVDLKTSSGSEEHEDRTALIDWNRSSTIEFCTGATGTWKYYATLNDQIYSDGRYAMYVFPLKEAYTNFRELLFVFGDISGGTPDLPFCRIKTKDFNFMMNCGGTYLDSCLLPVPGGYIFPITPYRGASMYNKIAASKSTPTLLKELVSGGVHYLYVLEIYGIGRK